MKNDLILCDCKSSEHQMIIHHDEDDKMVYVHIHLNKRPFFKRVWIGIKYIFGYRSRYGSFDEIILNSEHAEQFQNLVNTLKDNTKQKL